MLSAQSENYNIREKKMRKKIGIGMMGTGWMCKAHTNAYLTSRYMFWEKSNFDVSLVAIGGVTEEDGKKAAERYGYKTGCQGYRDIIAMKDVDVFDNVTPDRLHVEPTIEAIRAGKHVVCEKPMAVSVKDAVRMLDAVREAKVKNICGFCYRFVPAVRLAYELIKSGQIGKIYHFGGTYYQDQGRFENTPVEKVWYITGSGVDQGIASHMIDMSRWLVGEIASVTGMVKTYVTKRPSNSGMVDVNATEGFFTLLEFENGATGCMQCLGVANGKQSEFSFEIFGTKGSLRWDMADPNNLYVYLADTVNPKVVGWTKVCATEPNHPFMDIWWPRGHVLGWEHAHINMLAYFLECIAEDRDVAPYGGTFEDGYKVAAIIDFIHKSAETGKKINVEYER